METPPNILFITDDQHRWDWLEMTRQYPVRSPNLARLACEGVWYRQTYSTCPICMLARASLHRDLYAHQTGLDRNSEIRDRLKTALLVHYSRNLAPHRLRAE